MPLWKEDELINASSLCGIKDTNRVKESFLIAGGVARCVFDDSNPRATILEAITGTDNLPQCSHSMIAYMDAERARYLNKVGGTLLCLDVPEGTQLSFDNKQMVAGSLFKGFKMIPQGAHLFCYSAADLSNGVSPPSVQSKFLYFNAGDVIVRKWSAETEGMVELSQTELEAYIQGVRAMDFDRGLAPYPVDDPDAATWRQLTMHITARLLDRILPISRVIDGDASDYDNALDNGRRRRTDTKERDVLAKLDRDLGQFREARGRTVDPGTNETGDVSKERWGVPYFSVIPRGPPVGATPAEVSRWHVDRSQALRSVLDKYCSGGHDDELIGEIQFSFVLFVYGLAYSGFLQWRNLVTLVLQSDALVHSHAPLFTLFLCALRAQLSAGPTDLFASDISTNLFLKPLLVSFIEANFDSVSAPPDARLFEEVRAIKRLAENHLHWQISVFELPTPGEEPNPYDEANEDLPVIVYTEDSGF
eukprot:gene14586-17247_t